MVLQGVKDVTGAVYWRLHVLKAPTLSEYAISGNHIAWRKQNYVAYEQFLRFNPLFLLVAAAADNSDQVLFCGSLNVLVFCFVTEVGF